MPVGPPARGPRPLALSEPEPSMLLRPRSASASGRQFELSSSESTTCPGQCGPCAEGRPESAFRPRRRSELEGNIEPTEGPVLRTRIVVGTVVTHWHPLFRFAANLNADLDPDFRSSSGRLGIGKRGPAPGAPRPCSSSSFPFRVRANRESAGTPP